MIERPTKITKSGTYEWPWSGSGLIIVKGASGGDGGYGDDRGSGLGGKGGKHTLVIVDGHHLPADGGAGGDGGSPLAIDGYRGIGGSGKSGRVEFYSVSLPKGTEIKVQIGNGGGGGETTPIGRDDGFLKGRSGADGEVLLLPILT